MHRSCAFQVINAFSDQKGAEYKRKILQRIEHIRACEGMLALCLPKFPEYEPPSAVASELSLPPADAAATKTKATPRKPAKTRDVSKEFVLLVAASAF